MADPSHDPIRCPQCRDFMKPGFVSVSQGLHWLNRESGPYGGDFLESIPGTHAIMRPNRLPAWRCAACETITFRFGRDLHRQRDRAGKLPSANDPG